MLIFTSLKITFPEEF